MAAEPPCSELDEPHAFTSTFAASKRPCPEHYSYGLYSYGIRRVEAALPGAHQNNDPLDYKVMAHGYGLYSYGLPEHAKTMTPI